MYFVCIQKYYISACLGMCPQMKACILSCGNLLLLYCFSRCSDKILFWFRHLFLYSSFISELLALMPNMSVSRLNRIGLLLLHLLLLQCEYIFCDKSTKLHITLVTISHFQSRFQVQSLEEPTGLATESIWR